MHNSTKQLEDQNMGPSVEVMADADGLIVPDAYKPCRGTWAEFKTDVGNAVKSCKSMWEERWENVHDRVSDMIEHRKHPSAN
jgi:hypothetical protein